MTRAPLSFWTSWGVFVASLGLWVALPRLVAPVPDPWNAGEVAVAGFVLAIFGLVGGIGSFALRESLVFGEARAGRSDPTTAAGLARIHARMAALWAVCSAVGALGAILAHWSGRPAAGLPYFAGAAVLLFLHAPNARFYRRVCAAESEPTAR